MTPDPTAEPASTTGTIRSNSLKMNYLFNLIGSAWSALLSILFVPIYLRYIGVEGYGIIGFFTSLQAFLFLLDFGLSPTFNRELARLASDSLDDTALRIRTLTRSLATVNWVVSLIIGLTLMGLAPILANYWINASSLSVSVVTRSFIIMGAASAFQFPISFYASGLAGLQRQVASNIVQIVFGTLRGVGSLLVLAYVSPTIEAFLMTQALLSLLQVIVTAAVFYGSIPKSRGRPVFDSSFLKQISRFAAGNLGISAASLVLTQIDKIVLSKMIPLEEFGYYSLASMIATASLLMLAGVVSKVAYPQFSKIVSSNDSTNLKRSYHENSQLVSVLVVPAATILAVFSREVLLIWTRSEVIAEKAWILLMLSALGTGLNCLMWIPYYMQLAHGWTKLTLYKHVVAIFIFVPIFIWAVSRYGAVGGVASWVALNSVYMIVYIGLMHRKILMNEMLRWYFYDIGIPVVISGFLAMLGKKFISFSGNFLVSFISLAVITFCIYFATAISVEVTRNRLYNLIRQR